MEVVPYNELEDNGVYIYRTKKDNPATGYRYSLFKAIYLVDSISAFFFDVHDLGWHYSPLLDYNEYKPVLRSCDLITSSVKAGLLSEDNNTVNLYWQILLKEIEEHEKS